MTIEEKNSATYLRAYTNWRYQVSTEQLRFLTYLISLKCTPHFLCIYVLLSTQAEEKARVGVRLLGHLLRGASVRGGVQMEIIEIPLSERPIAVACCPVTGDLLVGCENTLVLFTLRRHNQQNLVRVQQYTFFMTDIVNYLYLKHSDFNVISSPRPQNYKKSFWFHFLNHLSMFLLFYTYYTQ